MKKFTVLFIFLASTAFAQQNADTRFQLNTIWKFELLRPVPFGDNSMAKAYSNNIGFGFQLGLFRYENFRFGGGVNYVQYKVDDKTLLGNFEYANYSSEHVFLSYEVPVTDALSVLPNIGYGYAKLHQKGPGRSYGWQDGKEFRLGATGNYYFSKYSSLYVGIHYIHSNLDIKTNREFIDFFSKMNQVQFAVGVQFD